MTVETHSAHESLSILNYWFIMVILIPIQSDENETHISPYIFIRGQVRVLFWSETELDRRGDEMSVIYTKRNMIKNKNGSNI